MARIYRAVFFCLNDGAGGDCAVLEKIVQPAQACSPAGGRRTGDHRLHYAFADQHRREDRDRRRPVPGDIH